MKTRRNDDLRKMAKKQGVWLWKIADELSLTDGNFSRLLRYELPTEKRTQITQIIDRLVKA
jgi:hypothetical protein